MQNFDSILAKARKLAALNADTSATDGERDNAQRMLDAHCARHGITPERLAVSQRETRVLKCTLPGRHTKPVLSKDLVTLAAQCLRFVVGENRPSRYLKEEEWHLVRRKRGLSEEKPFSIYVLRAEVTDLEYDEWRDCFHHYAEDFWESSLELKQQAKIATRAAKMALEGFVNQHGIFPPSPERSGKGDLSPDELAALIAAMQGSKGERFTRGRSKLQPGGLLL